MYVQGNVISGKCTFKEMYIRDDVVSAKCFSGKCNFWKVFFGEVYRIRSDGEALPSVYRSFAKSAQ